MSKHFNLPPAPHNPEHGTPTDRRYTFLDRELLRLDTTYREGMRDVREITYAVGSKYSVALLEAAIEKGLVLGQRLEPEQEREVFSVPVSSRPVIHDRSIASSDSLGYDDDAMLSDIGQTLRALAEIGKDQPLVLNDVGGNVAMIEYTRPDQPRIQLVPGFENRVHTVADYDTLLNHYAVHLHDELGDRFMHSAESFIQGFSARE